jgi:hypothetical protein
MSKATNGAHTELALAVKMLFEFAVYNVVRFIFVGLLILLLINLCNRSHSV